MQTIVDTFKECDSAHIEDIVYHILSLIHHVVVVSSVKSWIQKRRNDEKGD